MINDRTSHGDEGAELTPVEARQGTGPRNMAAVVIVSTLLAALAGTVLLAYYLS